MLSQRLVSAFFWLSVNFQAQRSFRIPFELDDVALTPLEILHDCQYVVTLKSNPHPPDEIFGFTAELNFTVPHCLQGRCGCKGTPHKNMQLSIGVNWINFLRCYHHTVKKNMKIYFYFLHPTSLSCLFFRYSNITKFIIYFLSVTLISVFKKYLCRQHPFVSQKCWSSGGEAWQIYCSANILGISWSWKCCLSVWSWDIFEVNTNKYQYSNCMCK